MHEFKILDPLADCNLDLTLIKYSGYSFFHTAVWAKVLNITYGYSPKYFTVIDGSDIISIIPVMEINSIVTGKRGVSLPFSDYCPPLTIDNNTVGDLINYIIDFGRSNGWKSLELRSGDLYFHPETIYSKQYFGHIIKLLPDEKEQFGTFSYSTQKNINKTLREGISVIVSDTENSLMEFYRLLCLTRKRHGIPPQPIRFFENIFHEIIKKGYGVILTAKYKDICIGAGMFFYFSEKAIFKYGVSDYNYQHVRPNNLILWEAIRYFIKKGCQEIDLGRTSIDNEGLRRFKLGWGANEVIMRYYKYNYKKNAFVSSNLAENSKYTRLMKVMPIKMLRFVGEIMYKHVG
jgi:hypothetical protein